MNPNRLFLWSITSALAGFLFGFDTVVISGAERALQQLWGLSDQLHGAAMSAALWGTVIGALLGSLPSDYFGRRPTLIWIGVLYFVSAIWSALAPEVVSFIIARFIGGVGVGISTVAAPLYISEIAPPHRRGRLTGLFQFNIVLGIFIAYLSNFALQSIGESSWRWMLGVEAIPAVIYAGLCLMIPESPRWLIAIKGDREAGLKTLRQVLPESEVKDAESMADGIALSVHRESQGKVQSAFNFEVIRKMRVPLLMAFLIAFFNQFSGINAILYFAPRIFAQAGLEEKAAFLQSAGIGMVNLIFTMIGLWLIDRAGRKKLLIIGSWGYIISLSLTGWAFLSGNSSLVPLFLFGFIAAHAVGQGAVIWVFIAEIFPNQFRALGQSVGCATHWIFAALITACFPFFANRVDSGYIMLFFAGMMVVQLIWVLLFVPETKGIPLEDVQKELKLK